MSGTLQNILVTTAALLALAWLVADRIRRRKAKDKCDTCALAQAIKVPPADEPR